MSADTTLGRAGERQHLQVELDLGRSFDAIVRPSFQQRSVGVQSQLQEASSPHQPLEKWLYQPLRAHDGLALHRHATSTGLDKDELG